MFNLLRETFTTVATTHRHDSRCVDVLDELLYYSILHEVDQGHALEIKIYSFLPLEVSIGVYIIYARTISSQIF
jgi:hypothetical protein